MKFLNSVDKGKVRPPAPEMTKKQKEKIIEDAKRQAIESKKDKGVENSAGNSTVESEAGEENGELAPAVQEVFVTLQEILQDKAGVDEKLKSNRDFRHRFYAAAHFADSKLEKNKNKEVSEVFLHSNEPSFHAWMFEKLRPYNDLIYGESVEDAEKAFKERKKEGDMRYVAHGVVDLIEVQASKKTDELLEKLILETNFREECEDLLAYLKATGKYEEVDFSKQYEEYLQDQVNLAKKRGFFGKLGARIKKSIT